MLDISEFITDPEQRERLSRNIRVLKAACDYTSNSIAELIMVSPSIMSRIENKTGKLQYSTVLRLSEHFKVSPKDLLNKSVKVIFE